MADTPPLNDGEREDLIAYLANELDHCDAQAMETRITRDPQVRAEAEVLRQTWDLLDYLPKPEPSPNFTHRTLSLVATLPPPGARGLLLGRRWLLGIGWAAALLLAIGGGYAGAPFVRPLPRPPTDPTGGFDPQLVRDLLVVERFHLHQHAADIHFLNELDRLDLFGDDSVGQ